MFCVYCGKQLPENGICDCRSPKEPTNDMPMLDPYQPIEEAPEAAVPTAVPSSSEATSDSVYNPYEPQAQSEVVTEENPVSKQPTPVANPTDKQAAIKKVFGSGGMCFRSVLLTLTYVLNPTNILELLTMIASWNIFGKTRKATDRISTAGYNLYRGVLVLRIICTFIIFLPTLVCTLLPSSISRIKDALCQVVYNYYSAANPGVSYSVEMTTAGYVCVWIFLLGVFLFNLIYLMQLRGSYTKVVKEIKNEANTKKVHLFPILLNFIGGVLNILSGILAILFFAGLSELARELLGQADAEVVYYILIYAHVLPVSCILKGLAQFVEACVLASARSKLRS